MEKKISKNGNPAEVWQISELAYAARLAETGHLSRHLLNAQGHLRSDCHSAVLWDSVKEVLLLGLLRRGSHGAGVRRPRPLTWSRNCPRPALGYTTPSICFKVWVLCRRWHTFSVWCRNRTREDGAQEGLHRPLSPQCSCLSQRFSWSPVENQFY